MGKVPENIADRSDLQIRFVDSFGKPGLPHYQSYKESKVLVVGAGSFLYSLIAVLYESGISKVHAVITDSEPTDRSLLITLAEKAKKKDPKAELQELTMSKGDVGNWKEKVQSFDWILYVSMETKFEEIQAIHTACRAEQKALLIATCMGQTGFAGPLVHPDSEGCWESAWRRLHHSAICDEPMNPTIRSAAGPLLANIIVFDMFRTITGVSKPELENGFFLLNLHTLEGSYHSFLPHPLITHGITTEPVHNLDQLLGPCRGRDSNSDPNKFLSFINRITSLQSGILHLWDEGDLKQLPLSQCRVQAVDPLSEGPAELLQVIIRSGLTHIEARTEAGLAGIEDYLTRLAHFSGTRFHLDRKISNTNANIKEFIEVGVGTTTEEAVYRGLQKCLTQQLRNRTAGRKPNVHSIQISPIKDSRCRYYLQALTTLQGAPMIGLGEDLLGFPVVWIGTGDNWYGCVGLNRTLALRMALQQALLKAQNRKEIVTLQAVEISTLEPEEAILTNLEITAVEDMKHTELVQFALPILKRNQTRLLISKMMAEPFLNEHLEGIFCFMLGKEEDLYG